MLSINGRKDSGKTDISACPPKKLFERQIFVDCGVSMIDRLQKSEKNLVFATYFSAQPSIYSYPCPCYYNYRTCHCDNLYFWLP